MSNQYGNERSSNMQTPHFEHLVVDVHVDNDIPTHIYKLLPFFIGDLHSINTQYTIVDNPNFTHYAFSNALFHIIADEGDTNSRKEYLLRVYGTSSALIDREREICVAKLLGIKGVGPRIYATFSNGRIEEFYPNTKVIDPLFGLKDSSLYQRIAKQLSVYHSMQIGEDLLRNNIEMETYWTRVTKWYQIASNVTLNDSYQGDHAKYTCWKSIGWDAYMVSITEWIKNVAPTHEQQGIGNGQRNALKVMRFLYQMELDTEFITSHKDLYLEYVARSFFYEMVLSHNDVYVGNVLYLKDLDQIKLIDFEYSCFNFRGFDLGVLIGYALCPRRQFKDENDIMSCEERKKYIDGYLMQFLNDKRYVLSDLYANKRVWNRFLDMCDRVVIEFVMICTYHWGLWAVLQSVFAKTQEVPYIDYAYNRLQTQMQCFKTLWRRLGEQRLSKL
eukprot:186836_1